MLFYPRYTALHTCLGIVPILAVPCLELAAINGHDRLGEKVHASAQGDKLATDLAYGLAIVLPEIGDGFEIRYQTTRQPHHLDVALGLTLQAATGLNAIEVAVNINLQQSCGMIAGPASLLRDGALEP